MAAWAQAASLADTGKGGCPMRIERRDPTLKYPAPSEKKSAGLSSTGSWNFNSPRSSSSPDASA